MNFYPPIRITLTSKIIAFYNFAYSHILRIIIQVYEDGNDDRYWKFIPAILPPTLVYLQSI